MSGRYIRVGWSQSGKVLLTEPVADYYAVDLCCGLKPGEVVVDMHHLDELINVLEVLRKGQDERKRAGE